MRRIAPVAACLSGLMFLAPPARSQAGLRDVTIQNASGAIVPALEIPEGRQIRPSPSEREFLAVFELDPAAIGTRTFSTRSFTLGKVTVEPGQAIGSDRWAVRIRTDAGATNDVRIPLLLDGNEEGQTRILIARPPFGPASAACNRDPLTTGLDGTVAVSLAPYLVNAGEVNPDPATHSAIEEAPGAVVGSVQSAGGSWQLQFSPAGARQHEFKVQLASRAPFYELATGGVVERQQQTVCVPVAVLARAPQQTTIATQSNGGLVARAHFYAGDRYRNVKIASTASIGDLPGDRLLVVDSDGEQIAEVSNVAQQVGGTLFGDLSVTADVDLLRDLITTFLVTPSNRKNRKYQIQAQFHPRPQVTTVSVLPLDLPADERVSRKWEIWESGTFRLSLEGTDVEGGHLKLQPVRGEPFEDLDPEAGSSAVWTTKVKADISEGAIPLLLADDHGRTFDIGGLRVIPNPTAMRLARDGAVSVGARQVDETNPLVTSDRLSTTRIAIKAPAAPLGTQHLIVVTRVRPEGLELAEPEDTVSIQVKPGQPVVRTLAQLAEKNADVLDRGGTNVDVSISPDPRYHSEPTEPAHARLANDKDFFGVNVDGLGGAGLVGDKLVPIAGAGFSLEWVPIGSEGGRKWYAFHGGVSRAAFAKVNEDSEPTPDEPTTDTVDSSWLLYGGATVSLPQISGRDLVDFRVSVGWFTSNKFVLLIHPGLAVRLFGGT